MPLIRSARLAFIALLVVRALAAQDSIPPSPVSISRANFDTTCSPCADFYHYVNGAWLDRTSVPPQLPYFGLWRQIQDRNEAVLHVLLEDARRQTRTTSDPTVRRVGTFYGTCMDTTHIERAGVTPLASTLQRIKGRDRRSLMTELGMLQRDGVDVGVPLWAFAGLHNSAITAVYLGQGGLGLPDRDFYLRDDTSLARIRGAYQAHLARLLALQTAAPPAKPDSSGASQAMAIETALARSAQPGEALRDPLHYDHPMTLAAVERASPNLDWTGFFRALEVTPTDTVTVYTLAEVTTLDSLVRVAPLSAWQAYLTARLLETTSSALSTPFQREYLVKRTLLTGETELRLRWQRCATATDNAIGEALGQLYVARAFTPDAKAHARELVGNLRAAMAERIRALTWMSDSTKAAALVKLNRLNVKIGYPDDWRDYNALQLSSDDYVLNVLRANQFESDRELAKVGKPVDRSEWGMTPPTVDAYSNAQFVEIVFPAGILQPPYFDPAADDALNYGAIGAVIGHEITHEFDDEGRQYDSKGNLRNWWTSTDSAEFVRRAALIMQQYSGYPVVDTMHINGQLTLGENIADIGGLIVSHDAWRRSLQGKPEPAPIDGFTPEQRFFLSFASVWRSKFRPELLRTMALSNPHSPPIWRVNGTVQHLDTFQAAFHCQQGDRMYRAPQARMQIW